MALPPVNQVIVRDTFIRANAGTLGANWTANVDATDTALLGITSNGAQVQSLGGRSASYWNANVFTPNQYSQVIINTSLVGTNTHIGGVTVRASATGYYQLEWNMGGSAGINLGLRKIVNGVFIDLGGTAPTNPAVNGSLLRLEVVGSQLSAYIDGNLVFQVTDTDLTSGAPGVSGFMTAASPTAFVTNWEGGNLIWTRRGTAIPVNTTGCAEPSVMYEANPKILTANADGKIWKMWFMNGWTSTTIWYAESNDGLTWTNYVSNPVISESLKNPGHGVVFKNGGTYYGYFDDDTGSAAAFFNRWTSPDGVTWTKTGVALPVGGAGAWDSAGLFNPCIWIQNGTWYMLYNGRQAVQYSMGLATSPDGITWTKYAGNPVLSTGGTAAEGKTIVFDGSTYYLWGFQSPTSNLPTDNAMWFSKDLINWTACPKNPIYQRVLLNEGANLAGGQIGDPYLVELNGQTYMFYDATNAQASGHFVINVATAPFTLLQLTRIVFGTTAYSVPDARNFGTFPNLGRDVAGTLVEDTPAQSSVALPVDSRVTAIKPVDSRVGPNIPTNSRTPGTYGPGQ